MNEKNTFDPNTPEWQLFEGMRSAEAQSRAYAADAERYLRMSADANTKAEKYRDALARLVT